MAPGSLTLPFGSASGSHHATHLRRPWARSRHRPPRRRRLENVIPLGGRQPCEGNEAHVWHFGSREPNNHRNVVLDRSSVQRLFKLRRRDHPLRGPQTGEHVGETSRPVQSAELLPGLSPGLLRLRLHGLETRPFVLDSDDQREGTAGVDLGAEDPVTPFSGAVTSPSSAGGRTSAAESTSPSSRPRGEVTSSATCGAFPDTPWVSGARASSTAAACSSPRSRRPSPWRVRSRRPYSRRSVPSRPLPTPPRPPSYPRRPSVRSRPLPSLSPLSTVVRVASATPVTLAAGAAALQP